MSNVQTQLKLEQCRGLPSPVWADVPSAYTSVTSQQTMVPAHSIQKCVTVIGTSRSNETHSRLHRTQLEKLYLAC